MRCGLQSQRTEWNSERLALWWFAAINPNFLPGLLVDNCCGAVVTGGLSDALERPQPTLLYPQAEGRGNVWLTKRS